MDYTPDEAPPAHEPLTVRLNGVRLIELGGFNVDPCDIVALADQLETIDLRTGKHVRTPRALVFVRDIPTPFASELTREEVRARIADELREREALVRSRMPKPPTPEEIEAQARRQQEILTNSMSAAMRAARKAADPDADAPWKQGE